MPTPPPIDHDPDAGAPVPRRGRSARGRAAVVTAATVVLALGVVLAVAEVLPVLAGWVLPVALAASTAAFLVLGRRAARSGRTGTARAWAGWAGATWALGCSGLVSLAGLGGALVAVLLVVAAGNAAIALWFRSPVHLVATQALGLVWAVVAHVYGTPPWALLVLALVGTWWTGAVGAARSVLASTTVLLPLATALLVHPVTHVSAAVDAADVAVLAAATGAAVTWTAAIRQRRPVATVWSVTRTTAVVVLVVQLAAGAVPAVATSLTPADPVPSVAGAAAVLLGCAAVAVATPVRAGLATVLVLAALQVAQVAATVAVSPAAGTFVGTAGLLVVTVVALTRARGALRGWTPARARAWAVVLVLPASGALLLGAPTLLTAAVLVLTGGTVAVLVTRGARSVDAVRPTSSGPVPRVTSSGPVPGVTSGAPVASATEAAR